MEQLHTAPQPVDKLISDRAFLGAHLTLVEVVGSGRNPAQCEGELLELDTAAEPHAFLLADEILPAVAINRRISRP
jgi:hypothetical protein